MQQNTLPNELNCEKCNNKNNPKFSVNCWMINAHTMCVSNGQPFSCKSVSATATATKISMFERVQMMILRPKQKARFEIWCKNVHGRAPHFYLSRSRSLSMTMCRTPISRFGAEFEVLQFARIAAHYCIYLSRFNCHLPTNQTQKTNNIRTVSFNLIRCQCARNTKLLFSLITIPFFTFESGNRCVRFGYFVAKYLPLLCCGPK